MSEYQYAQKKVFYSVCYTESIFFHLSLFSSNCVRVCLSEIRHYKSKGEEYKMFVKSLFKYNLSKKKHKFFKE